MISLGTIIICTGAALVAGFVDSIAGGGGLITLPALLLTNVPAHVALGSNKVSAALGTCMALGTFARSGLVLWRLALVGVVFCLGGSVVGSRLTFLFDNAILSKILVCLLPLGMLATLLPKKDLTHNVQVEHGLRLWLLTPLVCFCIGAYDGFYGPGTGSFLILALHFIVRVGLIQASATAKVLNLSSNSSAAVVFVLAGKVAWTLALPMAAGSILGNWLGSRTAIRVGPQAVRRFLTISLGLLFCTLLYECFVVR